MIPLDDAILIRTGLRERRRTTRADTFAAHRARQDTAAPALEPAQQGTTFRTPEWLERSFVMPVQPRPFDLGSATPEHTALRAPKLSERMAEVTRPTHAAQIDFIALVHRGDHFRQARLAAWGSATLMLALLAAYAVTGSAALKPLVCVVAAGAFAAMYVANRLASAPLPRIRR